MGTFRPYTIVSPDFQTTSGGIRVMYGLCGWLLAKGQVAFMNGMMGDDFIAVYPEIYTGNPSNSKNVVRYILNKPGAMSMHGVPGPTKFDPGDKLYVFSQLYNTVGVDENHILFLPILNLNLFKITNTGKRTKRVKLIGKGRDLHLPETEGLFEITRPFANDQAALADLLNECEVLYSYDNNSAMFEVARLCGCRVVIIPSIYTKAEFAKYEPGLNGISYGLEENEPLDAAEFRSHYQTMIKTFSERLEGFIDDTQS